MDLSVVSPESAVLETRITRGDPKASLTWYRDDKQIFKGDKYDIKYSDMVAVLIINDTDLNDNAEYRCEAANKIGSVKTQATLVVNSKLFW